MTSKALRESGLWRLVTGLFAVFAVGFTTAVALMGDHVTSSLWIYLFTAPGGKWTWAMSFAIGGAILARGLVRQHRYLSGGGFFLIGVITLALGVFSIAAPTFSSGDIVSLGFMPWLLIAALSFLAAWIECTDVDLS